MTLSDKSIEAVAMVLVPLIPTPKMCLASAMALDKEKMRLGINVQNPRAFKPAEKHAIRWHAMVEASPQGRDWQAIEALFPDIEYILNLFASALELGQGNNTNPIEYIYPVDLAKAGAVLTRLRAATRKE